MSNKLRSDELEQQESSPTSPTLALFPSPASASLRRHQLQAPLIALSSLQLPLARLPLVIEASFQPQKLVKSLECERQ